MKRIYLDYAATTPVDPKVERAMRPYFIKRFGNPSSLHFFGQQALAAIDEARETIAQSIGADFREIIFTSSATEANNLALRGAVEAARTAFQPRIIVSSTEHKSVLETSRDLAKEGAEVIYLPVNREGIVDEGKLKGALDEQTILVSVMYANNEIGTIQNISKIAKIISDFKAEKKSVYPLFHTDAIQAFQYLDCDVNRLGIDLMTLSAHKIYGPKGVGALYINSKFPLISPMVTGGGQEFGLRSGTENTPAIIGFAKAIELADKNRKKEAKRIKDLANYFWKQLKRVYPKASLNNSQGNRLPNILNIYFPGQSAEDLLIKFDLAGVAVSSGSACSARKLEPSYVLKACGFSSARLKSSLRISLGRPTTKKEIKEAIRRIGPVV